MYLKYLGFKCPLEFEVQRDLFYVATVLMPAPCVCDHLFQFGSIGRPAQFCFCAQRPRYQICTISRAARTEGDSAQTYTENCVATVYEKIAKEKASKCLTLLGLGTGIEPFTNLQRMHFM